MSDGHTQAQKDHIEHTANKVARLARLVLGPHEGATGNEVLDRAAATITALRAQVAAMREALEEIAKPDDDADTFYIKLNDERVIVCEWSRVQWRMDRAQQALTPPPKDVRNAEP